EATQKQVLLPIDERTLAPARLLLGTLYLRLNEPGGRDAARRMLSRISQAAAAEVRHGARLLVGRSYFEESNWEQALVVFEQLTREPATENSEAGLLWFWKGQCYDNL